MEDRRVTALKEQIECMQGTIGLLMEECYRKGQEISRLSRMVDDLLAKLGEGGVQNDNG